MMIGIEALLKIQYNSKPMNRFLLTTILFAIFLKSFSQENLPNGFGIGEKEKMPLYLQSFKNTSTSSITTPPTSPVRAMAEWEESQAIVITWTSYTAVLRQIVKYAQDECKVIIICSDSNQVKTNLSNNSIPIKNITFLKTAYNTVWARDYSGNSVYTNDIDSLSIVDWIYNRPRPNDDASPVAIANYLNVPIYQTTTAPYDLVHTGGNYMSDGFGTAFSSKLILDENDSNATYTITPKNETLIDSIMKMFMGIKRYIKMETLPYDDIHHIDMHMKLLNEETLLMGEYPTGVADGPQIEANLQYVLSNYNSMYGTAYKIKRIVMPPDANGDYPDNNGDYRTYTNSLIVNKTVLVPTYEEKYDTTALRVYKESMPGYNVVGIDCNDIITALGAIHCITHEIGVNDPLLISHQPLADSYDTAASYTVNVYVNHRSGIANATIYYTTDTTKGFQTSSMMLTDSVHHTWSGTIPSTNSSGKIFYYIHATANSGKQQVRPITAEQGGAWSFNISGITSVKENENIAAEKIFPNPANAITCIEVTTKSNLNGSIKLFDMMNKEIEVIYTGEIPSGSNHYFIDASKLSAGVYFVRFNYTNGSKVEKLIVK